MTIEFDSYPADAPAFSCLECGAVILSKHFELHCTWHNRVYASPSFDEILSIIPPLRKETPHAS
jgi:hypothetical protein